MRVLCTKSLYDNAARKFFQEGKVYEIEPIPMLANHFAFEPELRAELRAKQAANLKRGISPEAAAKTVQADAHRLIEIAHAKGIGHVEPKTLYDLAPKSDPVDNKPVVLAELTKALDKDSFLE